MLYKNDIFYLNGARMRLLHADAPSNTAWCIDMSNDFAWPKCFPYQLIAHLSSSANEEILYKTPSKASQKKYQEAWARLQPLLEKHGNDLFDPQYRNRAITEYARECNCSAVTLRKDLRKFWKRGQNSLALMPDYDKSGRSNQLVGQETIAVTAGRGRKPLAGHNVFQLTAKDEPYMREVIDGYYLKSQNISTVDAYTKLIQTHYRFEDGNGNLFANPPGLLPSLRQFRRFLSKHYNIEIRLRNREGDSDYEREHRKILGTTLEDCQGVGHFYEIDATIVDIYLVSKEDPRKIIGKPTLYLIIDRKSRLIVGFYFGLENASWNAAMQAILSISEDKHALCARYGVEYNPEDWPAHMVFPKEFLADRGDMISQASSNIVDGLQITVTNLPSKRPDWKPLVECGFRLMHTAMRPIAPAYDPPSNATRRRGKHYEKDACLTMTDFGNLILNTIIQHNRRQILKYPLSPAELAAGVEPCPISLWNHDIVSRSGLLVRYSEEKVRFALLRQEKASVTEHGIEFKGCYYSFAQAIAQKWFETARKRRFQVTISFDPRLVDRIYVHSQDGKSPPQIAELTQRSRSYVGYSFEEVSYYERLRQGVRRHSETQRLANSIEHWDKTQPVISEAKTRLKGVGKQSRSARREDTKAARNRELILERQQAAKLQQPSAETSTNSSAEHSSPAGTTHSDQSERLAAIRARMAV